MDTLEFLQAVWPAKGLYAIARPFKQDDGRVSYPCELFDRLSDAVDHVALTGRRRDTFFNVHVLSERRQKGTRKQDNMLACRTFFFDLDCGPGKPYEDQRAAIVALSTFYRQVGLPTPLLVSSGRGVHVYFRMSEAIPSEEWRVHAFKLRRLAEHYGLAFDPARITDTSSLLRVPGSLHLKDPANPILVEVRVAGEEIETADMLARIDAAFTAADLTLRPAESVSRKPISIFGSNTTRTFDGPPVTVDALEAACAQMARIIFNRGDVDQPQWYRAMGVLRFVENGEQLCHDLLDGHPDYDARHTDDKLAQLAEYGPTTCTKLEEVCGPLNCQHCPFRGEVKSPLVAARRYMAHTPIATADPETPSDDPEDLKPSVKPPWPFKLLESGIVVEKKDEDDTEGKVGEDVVVLPYVLFPLSASDRTEIETGSSEWAVFLPKPSGGRACHRFRLSIAQLSETRDLAKALLNEAVYVDHAKLNPLRQYMSAYLRQLQKHQRQNRQFDHLGWTDESAAFVLGEEVLLADGTKQPALLTPIASAAKTYMGKRGSLQAQIDALKFYNKPEYMAHQFAILCSLASPLLTATGLHGAIVNLSGDTGASKSTALSAAASIWGDPRHYVINGTPDGSTRNARNDHIVTLCNLPFCLDEITLMTPDDIRMFAFNISQPGGKKRLTASSTQMKMRINDKSLIALTTANTSLHALLATENTAGTAGAMRVFEIRVPKADLAMKPEADRFLAAIAENFGHIGSVFMEHVMKDREAIFQRVRATLAYLDTQLRTEAGERFWSGVGAPAFEAGRLAVRLGLLDFDIDAIERWFITDQFPTLRMYVESEHSVFDPVNMLAAYLNQTQEQIITVVRTDRMPDGTYHSAVVSEPRGGLAGHFDLTARKVWIRKDHFRDWCVKHAKQAGGLLVTLHQKGIVLDRSSRRTLGLGTRFAQGRVQCFIVNMAHPEISDLGEFKEPQPGAKVIMFQRGVRPDGQA